MQLGQALTPAQVPSVFKQAIALHQQGRLQQAQALYERVLQAQPQHVPSLQMLGTAAVQTGKFPAAVDWYTRAIRLQPESPELHAQVGFALQELGQLAAAVEAYDRALALNPRQADTCNNRGVALQRQMRLDEAIASYDQAIALRPGYAEAHFNRGSALLTSKQPERALTSLDAAIALRPDYVKAHVNRGVALQQSKRPDLALISHEKAIALNPYYPEAHFNRGSALQALKRLDMAAESYNRAIALRADYADAYLFKSTVCLLQGNFSQGLELYEWRWKTEESAPRIRPFVQPLWQGDASLEGKRILLHGEQGLGDMVQFCRYAKLVAARGAYVILEVPKLLTKVLEGLDGVHEMVPLGGTLPPFDFHCPLLSLPRAFQTDLTTIPHSPSYLRSHPALVQAWKNRLGPKTRPRVGIVWSGSPQHAMDCNRSITLESLLPYLPTTWECISLQKEVRAIDQSALTEQAGMRHFGDALKDFEDTAALCSLMDVVISVDTSVAHLSAALGQPTWILLPFVPDWRWLLDREDSPWYPSAKLYRQATEGDWAGVLARICADLRAFTVNLPPCSVR